jgi:transposase-like protein
MKQNEQAESSQTLNLAIDEFRDYIRASLDSRVREFALGYVGALILEEIEMLCGKPGEHKRGRGLAHRGGSQRGYIVLDGERVAIQKPGARRNGKEVKLERYEILQDRSDLRKHVERLMLAGISTGNYEKTLRKTEASLGLSRSTVSREFVKSSRESLNHLNSRRFPDQTFWCIVLDGIVFGGSVVIVALGVDIARNKYFPGISEGSTENADSALSVLQSIESRDIRFTDLGLSSWMNQRFLKKRPESSSVAELKFNSATCINREMSLQNSCGSIMQNSARDTSRHSVRTVTKMPQARCDLYYHGSKPSATVPPRAFRRA